MAFPQSVLPLKGELFIDGAWTDQTSYFQGDSGQNAFTIQRGYSNEQKNLQASSCAFTLNNPEGRFNTRNPLSPYFGLLPKNTPFRVKVTGYESYLYVSTEALYKSSASTDDKASLDITGDIDIAVDIEPDSWVPGVESTLASKYTLSGNQRSWAFRMTSDGKLRLYWSPDGTVASRLDVISTAALPTSNARMSVRVLLDVNNGAGGRTAYFSYSTTGITGPWTLLGSAVVTAGVTSIHGGTSTVDVGGLPTASNMISGQNFKGKIYKFLLKNSSAVTVASPDFSAAEAGVTSITDAQGNVFVMADSKISNPGVRFTGEISRFPYQADKSNNYIYSNVDASGIVRRLSQGATPLRSPMYRVWYDKNPTGYFPMEDGFDATSVANEVTGGVAGTLSEITFTEDSTLAGSAGIASIDSATSFIKGSMISTANTGSASAIIFFKMASTPGSETLIVKYYSTGTVRRWDLLTDGAGYRINGYGVDGSVITTRYIAHGDATPNKWVTLYLELLTSGGNISWTLNYAPIDTGTFLTTGANVVAGSVGRFTSFEIKGSTNLINTHFAHLMVNQAQVADSEYVSSANGFNGERAGTRIRRLSLEEGVPFISYGNMSQTDLMGPQTTNTYLELIQECAAVNDGLLYESKDFIGLEYIAREYLINRSDNVALSFGNADLSGEFLPVDDDQRTRNDVTVSRPQGSSARIVQTEGPNTPELIGTYQDKISLNANSDTQLPDLAGWRVFLGTWDEPRYERVEVQLARSNYTNDAALFDAVVKSGIGSVGSVSDIPVYQSARDVEFLVLGYTERLSQFQWDISWNAIPYGTFKANDLDAGVSDRADAEDSTLSAGVNTTATSLSVTSSVDPLWITTALYASEFPFDIVVGGEVMTVTAISGTSFPQTFTVTRSINGVVKSHSSGAAVFLADPFYVTL